MSQLNKQTSGKPPILKQPTQSISTLRDFKAQACCLFLNAPKAIQLYTRDLDPRILNNLEREKALIHFIKKSRSSQIPALIYQGALM